MLLALGAVLVALMTVDRARAPERVRSSSRPRARAAHAAGLPLVHAVYSLTWAAHGACAAPLAVGATPGAALGGFGPVRAGAHRRFPRDGHAGRHRRARALLSVGLAPAVGPAAALGAALISRATSLAVDVGGLLIARLLCRRAAAR